MAATILVCDDEAPLRQLVGALLDGCGYAILEAQDGEQALALARSTQPDLIILDRVLPERSGLHVLRELRNDPPLARTPMLMLSARAQRAERKEALAAGADAFLAKPFAISELLE